MSDERCFMEPSNPYAPLPSGMQNCYSCYVPCIPCNQYYSTSPPASSTPPAAPNFCNQQVSYNQYNPQYICPSNPCPNYCNQNNCCLPLQNPSQNAGKVPQNFSSSQPMPSPCYCCNPMPQQKTMMCPCYYNPYQQGQTPSYAPPQNNNASIKPNTVAASSPMYAAQASAPQQNVCPSSTQSYPTQPSPCNPCQPYPPQLSPCMPSYNSCSCVPIGCLPPCPPNNEASKGNNDPNAKPKCGFLFL